MTGFPADAPGDDLVTPGGVDAVTGRLLLPAVSVAAVARAARTPPAELRRVAEESARLRLLGPPPFDVQDLAQAGWGVVFAHDAPAAVRGALEPLLALRREQAGARFREYTGADGYTPPEDALTFRQRHGMGPGAPDPDVMPWYLLLVGDADAIPFPFQYLLGANHLVGRLALDDAAAYARYADTVVRSERGALRRRRSLAVFAPRHPADRATALSATHLAMPLVARVLGEGWYDAVTPVCAADASKPALAGLLRRDAAPGVLFTASHGIGLPAGHADQRAQQGALLCQGWDPLQPGPLSPDLFFAAADVDDQADVAGMMAFHFACYGAGTPDRDDFAPYVGGTADLAPAPFVAALPRRLLSHPGGAALAVVGHVDRAWGCSFTVPGVPEDIGSFTRFLRDIASDVPVGVAMQYFTARHAALAERLLALLDDAHGGGVGTPSPAADRPLAAAWLGAHDSRNYVILGDPAARLPTTA